jgi:hypothetical protein
MKKLLALASLFVVACATTPSQPPAERLAAVEQRLENENEFSLRFSTRTTGAVESHLDGTMNVLKGNIASIDADGEMDNKPATIRFSANGSPAQLNHTLVITLVRMGLTHDLYELSQKKPISWAEGGADAGVKLDRLQWDAKEKKFTYHMLVEGQDVAEGELWVERHDLPVRRKLTVHFPNGDMKVDERYLWR